MAGGLFDSCDDPAAECGPYRGTLPYARGSVTSKGAAEYAAASGSADRQRQTVLACIRKQGSQGATRQEIEKETRIDGNSVRPRVLELIAAGLVIETRETRRTQRHRSAFVLKAQE